MAQLINEAKRMQLLAGLISESQLEEAVATTDHLEVGEEYHYKSGTAGLPSVKIKIVKIVNAQYFIGEVLEENETTKYKGWNKGDKFQMNVSFIEETSNKQISANNPVVEPKNDAGEKNPKATEAFNKVVEWAKQNKLKTVGQVSEYGANDIYIRLWDSGYLDVIISTSKEKELIEFLKTLGGKMQRTHMDDEKKGARIGLNFEEVKESQLNEALNKDIRQFGNDVMKRLQQAGFEVEFGFHNDLSHTNTGTEIRKKIEDNPKYIYLSVNLSPYAEQMSISANAKSKKEVDNVVNKFQTSTRNGVEKIIRPGGMFAGPAVIKQVVGALNPGDIYSWGWGQYGNMIVKDYLRHANVTSSTKTTEKGGMGDDKVTYSKGTTKSLQPQAESLDIDAVVNEALTKFRKNGK